MNFKEAVPKDAAAVILLREDSNEIFLAQRNPQIPFLGGFHAFPGGKVDAEDAAVEVANCADETFKKFIVAAARETFEEVAVLLARGGERITKGQRASLRDDLLSGRFSFAEILEMWGLRIDARDFEYTGFWTTPKFSPVRFKTKFFLARCPRKQQPAVFGEFVEGQFIAPADALRLWENSEILISPPVLITLQTLAEENGSTQRRRDAEKYTKRNEAENSDNLNPFLNSASSLRLGVEKLLKQSQTLDGTIYHIKFHPFISCFPVRTETLPPATHTNCFIVGGREFVVIDAASPFAEEQAALHAHVDSLIADGGAIKELILTHLHRDHVSGVLALQNHLREKFDLRVPISAHRLTAESLRGKIGVEKFIEDDEIISLKISDDETLALRALHTPGHARGHLCFYDERRGFLLSGDNVVGAGSVLIAPPEGDMTAYLNSLERMKNLPGLRFLCGSHGAAIHDARGKIESYIAHRLERERKIVAALEDGAKNLREIVERVYTDVSPELWSLAEKSVAAHLEKIERDGLFGARRLSIEK
jgi:endoribonuclease LACTB2